jgi:hypothetical protein
MTQVPITEAFIHGAISCQAGDRWLRPWRLPFKQLDLFPSNDNNLVHCAGSTAGIRVQLATDADCFELHCEPHGGVRLFDLTHNNELLTSVSLPAEETCVCFEGLPGGTNSYAVWLPQSAPVALRSIGVPNGASLEAVTDSRPRWITYGSSISHCGAAHSPARTWPATAARIGDLALTCLGYGGQCHLDPMVARMIRDTPADMISLKVGINIQGGSSLSMRTFKPALIGAVQIIREKQPDIPIAVISPIISPPRETAGNLVGVSLTMMREELQDAVERLKSVTGDRNVHYFNGLDLFGEDLVADYLPDLLHPNGDGYEIMGRRFAELVLPTLKG